MSEPQEFDESTRRVRGSPCRRAALLKPMQRSLRAGVWPFLLAAASVSAQAQPSVTDWSACQLQVEDSLSANWKDALVRACTELTNHGNLDASAHVDVEMDRTGLLLRVRLRDGRSTVRHVDSADGLLLTLTALLVLPAPEEQAQTVAPQVAEPIESKPAPAIPTPVEPQPVADTREPAGEAQSRVSDNKVNEHEPSAPKQPARSPSRLHLGLSASVIGHVLSAPTYVAAGFAVGVALRLGAILLALAPRWEAEQASLRMRLPDFEMHNFGFAGFLGVRVWDAYDGAAEIGGGALLLAETQSYREEGVELDGTVISGQLAAFARLLWGEGTTLRWSMNLEITLSPHRLVHETRVRDILPPLPGMGIGIGFGGNWESS